MIEVMIFAFLVALAVGLSGNAFHRKLFVPLTNRILRRMGETEIPSLFQDREIAIDADAGEVLSFVHDLLSADDRYKEIEVTPGRSVVARTRKSMESWGEQVEVAFERDSNFWLIKSQPLHKRATHDFGLNFKNV